MRLIPLPPPRTRGPRRGFTLPEVMITLVVLVLLGVTVAGLMLRQQRFYQRTTEEMAVRRSLRRAVAMLPLELQGLSSAGGDLSAISTSSLTFRSTMGTAIVCAEPSATQVDVPPVNTARTTTTNWYATPAIGDTLFAWRGDSLGVAGDYWSAHRITAVATGTTYCPGTPYVDATLDAGKTFTRFTVTPALPDSVGPGSALRFTRSARYTIAAAPSGRWYLNRAELVNGTWQAAVPVAGPLISGAVAATGGLVFAYFDSTGAATAIPTSVSRIDVQLRAQGNNSSGTNGLGIASTAVRDSVSIGIAVRNRR